jgi:hypothetical protein
MVAFRPVPILNGFGSGGPDPVETLGYGCGFLFLGTRSGWVFRCSVSESSAPEDVLMSGRVYDFFIKVLFLDFQILLFVADAVFRQNFSIRLKCVTQI